MKVLKIIAGIILIPFFLVLFFADRQLCVVLPWLQSKTMMSWFRDTKIILESLIRVVFVTLVILMIYLLFRL